MARRKQWLTSERKTKFALAISAAMLLVTAAGTTVDKWIAVDEVAVKVAAVRVK